MIIEIKIKIFSILVKLQIVANNIHEHINMIRSTLLKKVLYMISAFVGLNLVWINLKERQLTNQVNLFYLRLHHSSSTFKQTNLSEYFRLSDTIANQANSLDRRRILFNGNFRTDLGYGNLLYSFISSMVAAILTESQFVLRQKNINQKVLAPPFDIFNNVSETTGFETNKVMFYLNSFHFTGSKTSQAWLVNKSLKKIVKAKTMVPLGYMRYFNENIDPIFMEICANPIYYEKLFYYGLVERKTVLDALDALKIDDERDCGGLYYFSG